MNSFELLAVGKFSSSQLIFIPTERKDFLNEQVACAVERCWQNELEKAKKSGKLLYNGPISRLEKYSLTNDKLVLFVSQTDFKESLGTNFFNPHFAKKYGASQLANGLAVCTLLETRDNFFLFPKRSKKVYIAEGYWHLIAGQINSEDFVDGSRISAFNALFSELKEEGAIEKDKISECFCLGLVRDKIWQKPELVFYTKTILSKDEIGVVIPYAKDRFEYSEIKFVHRNNLTNFFKQEKITGIAKANFAAFQQIIEQAL
jgi:hypothetical protein